MKIVIFVLVNVMFLSVEKQVRNRTAKWRCKCRTPEPRNRIADSCTVGCQARSVHEKLLNQGFRLPNGDDGVWFGSLGSDRSAMSRMVVGR